MKKIRKFLTILIIMSIMIIPAPININASDAISVDTQLLANINALRIQKGLQPLVYDSTLSVAAEIRSDEAAVVWSHVRPNGQRGADLIDRNKWRGENLAYVTYTYYSGTDSEQINAANAMFTNLCNSSTHYTNMVFPSFTKIGIATSVIPVSNGIRITTACMFSN